MIRIALLFGSSSDIQQCLDGLTVLNEAVGAGKVELVDIRASSIHRTTRQTLAHIGRLSRASPKIDVLITAAGWANHLTGISDAYLRSLGDTHILVVGVALEDATNPRHSMAARLSITEVPGTQVVYKDAHGDLVGADGFRRACEFAINGEFPEISIPKPRSPEMFTLAEAIALAGAAQATPERTG